MSINIQKLEKYLFKPLLIKSNNAIDGQKLALIYAYEVNQTKTVGQNMKFINNISYIVHILFISDTIETGQIIVESAEIKNIKEFFKTIIIPEEGQFVEELAAVTSMLEGTISSLLEETHRYITACNAVKTLVNKAVKEEENNQDESLIIATPSGGLAHIVYNTIGEKYPLKEADVAKIGNVIRDVVINHQNIDVENEEETNKLKAEIEYKIIEAMPIQLKAGEIHINMDFILQEIQNSQDGDEQDGELQ